LRLVDDEPERCAALIASEPLSDDASWREVPTSHLALIGPDRQVEVRKL
jgi:predicted glutamine amidotransferase